MAFVRFQWLKDYQELDEQILYLKWNLNKSKLELNRWVNGDLADVRIEKNSRSASLEENIQKIENEIDLLEEQRKEMLAIINSFKGIDNEIIRKKYVEGCSLEIIAEEIGYSASYVRQRHADIRKTLDFLDEYEMNKVNRQNKLNEIDYYNNRRDEPEQISLF
ncbi:phage protein [Enterococcus hirae]|nr:phage protein [Enterococcus hirae]